MEVIHQHEQSRFVVLDPDGDSELNYRLSGDVMDIHRTYTPEAQRGKGIAGEITKAALDYAKFNDLKVIPSCPYVARYIEKNEDYKKLIYQ